MEGNWVLLVLLAVAVGAGGTAVWLGFARKRDPEIADAVVLALTTVARLAGQVLSERELTALAEWAYDLFGVSRYYSKEDWVAFVLRVIRVTEPTVGMAPKFEYEPRGPIPLE